MSVGSLFHKVEAVFKKLFGSTNWEQTALTTLKVAGPVIEGIVGLTAGEPGQQEATAIINEIQTDLAASIAIIQQVQAGIARPGTVVNVLKDAQANLGTLLTAGHIKNPDKVQQITATVNMVIGGINAILTSLPPGPVAAAK